MFRKAVLGNWGRIFSIGKASRGKEKLMGLRNKFPREKNKKKCAASNGK